jgi:hypothetical protein
VTWRAIHDDVNISRSLTRLSDFAERLYWRMLAMSDDCGRGPGEVMTLTALCIPTLLKATADVQEALEELTRAGLIRLYLSKDAWAYEIVNFDQRQLVQKMKVRRSKYTAPPGEPIVDSQLQISAGSPPVEERTGDETRKTLPDEPAKKEIVRPPDELWDALVSVLSTSPQTKTERGRWNAAVKELREAQATPADVRARAKIFHQRYPNATLTATALSSNWGSLAPKRLTIAPCEQCGVGGGQHTADCPVVAPFTDADMENVGAMIREHSQ